MMYTMLVVDDELLIARGMRKALDRLGLFETFEAHSGLEALDVMRDRPIDAMLLDIAMPDMNGSELMRVLADRGEKPLTIVISGYEEFAYAQRALAFGAVDYVLKPVDSEDVMRMGARLFDLLEARAQQRRQLESMRAQLDELTRERAAATDGTEPESETKDDAEDSPSRVAALVKCAIERHYQDHQLSVNRLSELLNYSPNHLGSVFKRAYGMSINDHLAKHRVNEAMRLMDQRHMMIYEIAERVGFSDQNYFSKTFKKYVGVSPSEYRDR